MKILKVLKKLRISFFEISFLSLIFLFFINQSLALAQQENIAQDYKEPINIFFEASQKKGAPLSPEEAFNLLKLEAENGNPKVMVTLGHYYKRAYGVDENFGKAFELFLKASEADWAEGFYNVAYSYEIGVGTTPDINKALEYYQKAAEKNHPLAFYKFYTFYSQGFDKVVKKDESVAFDYLFKSADLGLQMAIIELAEVYQKGLLKQEVNPKEAFTLLSVSAAAGIPESMKKLAELYSQGIGTEKNLNEALKWYLIAEIGELKGLENAISNLKKQLSEEEVKKIEDLADKWILNFTNEQGNDS